MFDSKRPDYTGRGPKNWQKTDAQIHDEVCEALAAHPFVDASEVEVEVAKGIVTLKGTVEDRPMKKEAERAAEHVAGVQDVRNELNIKRTWIERMADAAGGNEARNGDGLLGSLPRDSNWRPRGWPI